VPSVVWTRRGRTHSVLGLMMIINAVVPHDPMSQEPARSARSLMPRSIR
jgi:hypothetical protein